MMTNKEKLVKMVEFMSDKQAEHVYKFLNVLCTRGMTKGQLMGLAFPKGIRNVDSALPHDLVEAVQEILPSFSTYYHVTDFRMDEVHGVKNIAQLAIFNLNNTLNNWD